MQATGAIRVSGSVPGFFRSPATCWGVVEYLAPEAQEQALQQKAGKKKGLAAVLHVNHI